jgi:DNA-binding transcriptional LysR family regulator
MGELEAALAVARHRSFRAAATELDLSTSALSHTVAALEASLGVRLFNRTTRSVSLSSAGAEFIESITPALATIRGAMERAGNLRETPAGTLRINTSLGAAKQVMPMLMAFLQQYPEMALDIVTEGHLVDIVAGGFDAGIRMNGRVPQDMIAVPFGMRLRYAIVGSPAYFKGRRIPTKPVDLATHACIRARTPSGAIDRWEFTQKGKTQRVDVKGVVTLDEPTLMLEAARAGLGIAYLAEWHVTADLAAGRLVRVLSEWTQPLDELCLYYPGRHHLPAGLRALVEWIKQQRSGEPVASERKAARK